MRSAEELFNNTYQSGRVTFHEHDMIEFAETYASQFREPSTQGGEEKNLQECFDGLWRDNQKNIAEIDRLKQENERLKEELIRKNNSISKLRISVNQKKKF